MTDYRFEIPPEVAEVIRHLPPELKRSVKEALRGLSRNPTAGEPLRRELQGLWKYRVRRYRVVYAIEPKRRVLRILGVGPRVEIYERVAARLRRASPKKK
ncbi:MAG TPA: type II toxin-antitoxin system RelE/ParE family toxin [Vicinamibacteria bacterium]|jgi:mRNA interferase RelE/StbE